MSGSQDKSKAPALTVKTDRPPSPSSSRSPTGPSDQNGGTKNTNASSPGPSGHTNGSGKEKGKSQSSPTPESKSPQRSAGNLSPTSPKKASTPVLQGAPGGPGHNVSHDAQPMSKAELAELEGYSMPLWEPKLNKDGLPACDGCHNVLRCCVICGEQMNLPPWLHKYRRYVLNFKRSAGEQGTR